MSTKLIIVFIVSSLLFLPFKIKKEDRNILIDDKPKCDLPNTFDKVYNTFNTFNNNTDTSLVITFCKVSKFYGLDTNEVVFNWLLGQVLQESGAQQYRRNNKLVVSKTGAVGFAQILRSTSILYLKNTLTKNDSVIFDEIGVTDYSFIHNRKYCKRKKWAMARTWLSNEVNNIAMWGKIMSNELKHKGIVKALITYNIGPRALKRYLRSGRKKMDHHYIVSIKSRFKHIK